MLMQARFVCATYGYHSAKLTQSLSLSSSHDFESLESMHSRCCDQFKYKKITANSACARMLKKTSQVCYDELFARMCIIKIERMF
jgi:hypothetical protein